MIPISEISSFQAVIRLYRTPGDLEEEEESEVEEEDENAA